MDNKSCFMYKNGTLDCGIEPASCGMNCPFRKTEAKQKAIENKIVKRFKKINYAGKYRSCITGEVLYDGFSEFKKRRSACF